MLPPSSGLQSQDYICITGEGKIIPIPKHHTVKVYRIVIKHSALTSAFHIMLVYPLIAIG